MSEEEVLKPLQESAIKVLDKHFPKGVSKERGAAMVMLAEWIELILPAMQKVENKYANKD